MLQIVLLQIINCYLLLFVMFETLILKIWQIIYLLRVDIVYFFWDIWNVILIFLSQDVVPELYIF